MEIDPKTIREEFVIVLGSSAPSCTTVARLPKSFHEGREDVNDHPRSSSSLSEFTGENIELIRQIITNELHSTYDEIIAETFASHSTIEQIIHERLKMEEVRCPWIPHQLTDEQKQQRVKLCCEYLAKFQNDF